MKVEVLKHIKGEELWKKGMVFDDTISPIPRDVMAEVAQGARTVRVLPEPKPEVTETIHETTINVPEEEETPEAATEKTVEAEPDNASFLTKEKPTKHLPELEGLIHAKGTIAAVSNLLNVSYQTITRWRKGATPKPEILTKIKKEYEKLRPKHDQHRNGSVASTGIEGAFE